MAKFTKRHMKNVYRILVFFFGILFIYISGCRPMGVDESTGMPTADSAGKDTDDHVITAPEKDVLRTEPEETDVVHIEKAEKGKTETDNQTKEQTKPVNPETVTPVQQPDPGPLQPVTAYGTNIHDYRNTIIIRPSEE